MIGSLPGLATGLLGLATIGLGTVGLVVHLVVAAMIHRRSPRALSTAAGPVVCALVGLASLGIGQQLDDVALAIPSAGVLAWIGVSAYLGLREASA